ncbi:restriction endonuclease subunit S [Streptomyces sp. NPDC016459]|uniref:restriction endonuclease subunit S n=1 Tax=Streptomyces sp. NPDC016459 TaxID=3157190 RepID=UPI00340EDC6F
MTQAQFDLEQAWADNVPSRWRWSRNKELLAESLSVSPEGTEELLSVSHLTGITPRSEKNVTMTAAESLDGYRLVDAGDLVINTMWAWMGALGVSKQAGIVSPAYGVYRPRPNAAFCPGFYDYLYRSTPYVMEMTRLSRGIWSSRLRIYPDVFLRMAIPVPPLEEQRAIADYLDRETSRIDTLIEEQQRLIEMLSERRVATVAETLDGYERTQVRRLVDHDRPMTYGILQCGEPVDGGVVYIGPSDIQGEGQSPDRDALRTTAPEIASAYKRSVLKSGDVVVSIGPAYGKVAVVSADLDGANLTQDTVRVALRPDLVDTRFFVWALLSRQTAEYWDYQVMGATFRRLNLGTLARTPVPLPAIQEQRRIAVYLDEQTAKIDTLIAEAERFIELSRERRSALITAAVTGQIDVREAA